MLFCLQLKTVDGIGSAGCATFLILAFVMAGVAQTIWFNTGVSRRFALPLDQGKCFRGRRIFGPNKTLRGVIVMVPAAALSFLLLAVLLENTPAPLGRPWPLTTPQYGLLGLIAGLGFMAGELPNSFLKRQLDIPPGGTPHAPAAKAVFFLADRVDSILGMLLAVAASVPTPWGTWFYLLLVGPFIHWSFSLILYLTKVKERPA